MTYRLQNLLTGFAALIMAALLALAPAGANPTSGGYQLFEQTVPEHQAAIQRVSLGNFTSCAESTAECCNATNRGYVGPKVDPVPPKQADFPPGSTVGSAKAWTKTARIKDAQLPNSGQIRFVPDSKWDGSTPIKRGPNNGYLDRFGNEWTKGPSRTPGQAFEWDVQLSNAGRQKIGWTTRDGSHANVSLDGRITHK